MLNQQCHTRVPIFSSSCLKCWPSSVPALPIVVVRRHPRPHCGYQSIKKNMREDNAYQWAHWHWQQIWLTSQSHYPPISTTYPPLPYPLLHTPGQAPLSELGHTATRHQKGSLSFSNGADLLMVMLVRLVNRNEATGAYMCAHFNKLLCRRCISRDLAN